MAKIKAILFDMDGVLIEAKEWHYKAFNKALDLFGFAISHDEHLSSYDGLPTSAKLEKLTITKGLPQKLHSFIGEMKQQYTIDIIHSHCRPRFNHEFALSRLKGEGYRLACCSNSIRQTMQMMLKHAHLAQYLEFMLSNQDVLRPKPDPEIYITAMKRMNLLPSECLILEDNINGIRAAIDSGAHLLKIKEVDEVTCENIKKRIKLIEEGEA